MRISIGSKYINLRTPFLSTEKALQKQINWAGDWLDNQLLTNPNLLNRFEYKAYNTGDIISINDDEFILNIEKQKRESLSGKIVGPKINLKIPFDLEIQRESELIKKLLSRIFAVHYKPYIVNRILDLNFEHFNEKIHGIRIKYNKSNWGSCSAKGNINISSRLLFAPKDVQDYVFIHELTHLKELNHSTRFWQIISSVIPDYKKKEKWLKEHGHSCDF